MDDPFAGDDRQHKSWRDLPPTPPLVWPTTPPFATAPAGAGASPMPLANLEAAPTPRHLGTALLVGAIASSAGLLATGNASGRCWPHRRWRRRPDKAARCCPPSDEPLADTAAGSCPRSCRSRPAARSAPASWRPMGPHPHRVARRRRSDVVTLTLQDGTSISGTVVAVDKSIDTAVIRAEERAPI